ncbi:12277_t:CDS:2, partial [Rhizophagus irregularis]
KLRQQSEQVITIPSVEENEISPSDHNVNNERHLPSHQNKNLTIPVVTPYQPINDLPTSYSQANVGRVFLSQNVDSQFTQFRCLSEKLRQQSEQAVTIPSVEENEISPSDHNANNERHLPSHQNENLIPVVMPCQPIDDLPSYSQENVGRVVLSQNVDSQFTEFRCLSGYFHKDQEDLDRCYKNFIKKYDSEELGSL